MPQENDTIKGLHEDDIEYFVPKEGQRTSSCSSEMFNRCPSLVLPDKAIEEFREALRTVSGKEFANGCTKEEINEIGGLILFAVSESLKIHAAQTKNICTNNPT